MKKKGKKYNIYSLFLCNFSVAKPEQITTDTSDNNAIKLKAYDLEIIHTYTLHNKGPSDAKRTEIKFMWPMLPLSGFNQQTPLLYGIDLPSIIRVSDPKANNDQCYIYQSVRKLDFFSIDYNYLIFLDNKSYS
jgi:hypothetical protein